MGSMRTLVLFTLVFLVAFSCVAQTAIDPPPSTNPQYILGSGLGFKPYQTSIKDGSSGFVQGAVRVSDPLGLYTFARVVLHPTYAEMVIEPCKTMPSGKGRYTLFLCAGAGMAANSDNVGVAFDGGGKLAYDVSGAKILGKSIGEHTWLMVEMGVSKSSVPAPVSAAGTISPVQPDFRVGIFKTF